MRARLGACGACTVLASVRDVGDVGTISIGRIRMAPHAARSSLLPPRSSLRSFLFWTILLILPSRFSAYSSLQPTLAVLPLYPPTIYPSPSLPSLAHTVTDCLTRSAPRSASYKSITSAGAIRVALSSGNMMSEML
ncbi:hypothetical protein B0H13DRAFT_2336223 [Mycena leptocephala]|nr:hypothetical protein B0H13DRAFT_2336223 [Mycena leptocephala]